MISLQKPSCLTPCIVVSTLTMCSTRTSFVQNDHNVMFQGATFRLLRRMRGLLGTGGYYRIKQSCWKRKLHNVKHFFSRKLRASRRKIEIYDICSTWYFSTAAVCKARVRQGHVSINSLSRFLLHYAYFAECKAGDLRIVFSGRSILLIRKLIHTSCVYLHLESRLGNNTRKSAPRCLFYFFFDPLQ